MSLPASDAFSLSHDTNRSSLSSSLRATSPKLPFVSGQQTRAISHALINPRKTVRPRTGRGRSMGDPNGHLQTAHGHSHDSNGIEAQLNGELKRRSRSRSPKSPSHLQRRRTSKQQAVPVVVVARSQSSSPSAGPIDWEIPRKTLHSSIGMFSLFLHLVVAFDAPPTSGLMSVE